MRDHSSRRRLAAVAVCVALAFVAASCGDDSDSDSSSDTTGGAATTAAGAATTGGGAATTGGSDVDLTGQTIKLGVANNEGPALSLPEFRHGVEVAVDYVNANGGINGAEIEIIECINDGSPEGSVNCANQFVDEGAVAYFAAIDVGADAALPILTSAGIPYVSTEPWGATQKTDPNSWILGAPQGAYTAGPLQALADQGAKKVAAYFRDIPTSHDLETSVIQPIAEELGLDVNVIYVDATNPDWASAVATAQADGVDSMWGILQEGDCIAVVGAARAAVFDGQFEVGSCSAYIAVLGAPAALNTITVTDTWFPQLRDVAPAAVQPQLDIYTEAMTAGGNEAELNGFAVTSFAAIMELSGIMTDIGAEVTAESLTAALGEAGEIPGFMRPDGSCRTDIWPSEPATCRASLLFLQVNAGADGAPERTLLGDDFVDLSSFAF